MDLTLMRDIFSPHLPQINEKIFLNGELGIIRGDHSIFNLIMRQKPPFSINDHRFGMILGGEAHINFNLQDRHLNAGTLVYLGPGTIINPVDISDDFRIYGIGLFAGFHMPFAGGLMPAAFNGQVRDFQLHVTADELGIAQSIIDTVWHIVRGGDGQYHRPTVGALVAALMHHYDRLFRADAASQDGTRSRQQIIFDRFIRLAGQHCTEQHQIAFYARELCLTQRYLSTVVRQTSGTTAKDWIDRALITRIKIELRHSDKTAAQIAEEMHFPNPSFFSKFFHRMTGMTPMQYKAL